MRVLVVILSILVVGAAAMFALPATGQDRTEDRLSALETRVAALETAATDERAGTPQARSLAEPITIKGTGVMVSEEFVLPEGRYRIDATVAVESEQEMMFRAVIHHPSGGGTILFVDTIEGPQEWEGFAVFEARRTGGYFIEVTDGDAPWSLQFERL